MIGETRRTDVKTGVIVGKYIRLFMWGYQPHFRSGLEYLAKDVLEAIGADVEADVLLVGARRPEGTSLHPVCIEPEDDKWSISLFEDLLPAIESAYENHDQHHMFYGDARANQEKFEWARRDAVRGCVQRFFEPFDQSNNVTSFCGASRCIDDYYVTPIIQLSNKIFEQYPLLPLWKSRSDHDRPGYRGMIHASMLALLSEASEALVDNEAGRDVGRNMRSSEEIVRIAARNFLWTAGSSTNVRHYRNDLFDVLNLVSSLMYEGAKGIGELTLINADQDQVEYVAKFSEPISLREPRWVRKVLEMAKNGVSIVTDCDHIYGIGTLQIDSSANERSGFSVRFIDHYHWELRYHKQVLLRSHYSVPRLPKEPFNQDHFIANYRRLFPHSELEDAHYLWSMMMVQTQQRHGSMIVVAADIAAEAERLGAQGTRIEPVRLTAELLQSASGIDGTIMLDPFGSCHAIGMILDGDASEQCTPSRGSRYNSGVRYVRAGSNKRLAIVVSDDGTVDLIPRLRPMISGPSIEKNIELLEQATRENYREPRNWLDNMRFYINSEQCIRINAALDRLDALPHIDGIYILTPRFVTHPEMDGSYILGDK
jgi:hypothetical protein